VRTKASSLQITDLELEESLQHARTRPRHSKNFAVVPLDNDWGYKALKVTGPGDRSLIKSRRRSAMIGNVTSAHL
jgi:hypothetical protein